MVLVAYGLVAWSKLHLQQALLYNQNKILDLLNIIKQKIWKNFSAFPINDLTEL